jgi:hypothetical protein
MSTSTTPNASFYGQQEDNGSLSTITPGSSFASNAPPPPPSATSSSASLTSMSMPTSMSMTMSSYELAAESITLLAPRGWTKEDWQALDSCFTDERLELAGAPDSKSMAVAGRVDVEAVLDRFLHLLGMGSDEQVMDMELGMYGPDWTLWVLLFFVFWLGTTLTDFLSFFVVIGIVYVPAYAPSKRNRKRVTLPLLPPCTLRAWGQLIYLLHHLVTTTRLRLSTKTTTIPSPVQAQTWRPDLSRT